MVSYLKGFLQIQALDWLSSRLSVERQLARRVDFARAGFLRHPCQLSGRCIGLMGYDTNNFMPPIDSVPAHACEPKLLTKISLHLPPTHQWSSWLLSGIHTSSACQIPFCDGLPSSQSYGQRVQDFWLAMWGGG